MPDSSRKLKDTEFEFILHCPFPEINLQYPEFTVRSANSLLVEDDFLQILYYSFGEPRMTHEYFEQDITEGWYTREDCLVMYDGEKPVAAGQIRVETRNGTLVGFLDTLGVPSSLQNRGYGLELTKRRIQMLFKLGVSEIRTEVEQNNDPMIKMLLKLGFLRA